MESIDAIGSIDTIVILYYYSYFLDFSEFVALPTFTLIIFAVVISMA